ncbi:hypothetical protein CSB67_1865 [Enterobacter hormaechei]|nr:hypothetical protein CSB67_1865 [Enterobacter hormaechei]
MLMVLFFTSKAKASCNISRAWFCDMSDDYMRWANFSD